MWRLHYHVEPFYHPWLPSLRNLQGPLYGTGLRDLRAERHVKVPYKGSSRFSMSLDLLALGISKLKGPLHGTFSCTSCLEDLSNWHVFLVTKEKLIVSLNLIWRTCCTHTNLSRDWRTNFRYCVLKSFNIMVKRSKLLGCTNRIHQPHPLFQMGCLAPHSPKKQFLYAH
jgi:hypothetical protein